MLSAMLITPASSISTIRYLDFCSIVSLIAMTIGLISGYFHLSIIMSEPLLRLRHHHPVRSKLDPILISTKRHSITHLI